MLPWPTRIYTHATEHGSRPRRKRWPWLTMNWRQRKRGGLLWKGCAKRSKGSKRHLNRTAAVKSASGYKRTREKARKRVAARPVRGMVGVRSGEGLKGLSLPRHLSQAPTITTIVAATVASPRAPFEPRARRSAR